ncbi:MAG: NAD(P)-dependent oxidoreductase [Alphaproteobacteria bacterium]
MAGKPRIVYPDAGGNLAELIRGERLARLEALGAFAIHYGRPADPQAFIERIGEASGVLSGWGLPVEALRAARNLEIVSFTGTGAANFIDLEEAARRGIAVTNTPGATGDTVAEHTMALMLAAARHVARLDRETRSGVWNQELPGVDLKGKTLGLIGFGGIAQRTAALAKAFGMRVIAWTRNPSPERAAAHGIAFADLDAVLAESDVLSLHLLLTPETEGLIDADRLQRTKPGVVVVNTARAQIVDEAALIELLRSGHVAAAGIDVYMEEPLPPGHPLTELDNVVLTPHSAYNTPEAGAAILDMAIANLEAFYAGTPTNLVTP